MAGGEKMGTFNLDDRNRVYEELTTSSQKWRLLLLTSKIGEVMLQAFRSPIFHGFHTLLKRKAKDMEPIKCGVIGHSTYDTSQSSSR